jgi:hypothetical protein
VQERLLRTELQTLQTYGVWLLSQEPAQPCFRAVFCMCALFTLSVLCTWIAQR